MAVIYVINPCRIYPNGALFSRIPEVGQLHLDDTVASVVARAERGVPVLVINYIKVALGGIDIIEKEVGGNLFVGVVPLDVGLGEHLGREGVGPPPREHVGGQVAVREFQAVVDIRQVHVEVAGEIRAVGQGQPPAVAVQFLAPVEGNAPGHPPRVVGVERYAHPGRGVAAGIDRDTPYVVRFRKKVVRAAHLERNGFPRYRGHAQITLGFPRFQHIGVIGGVDDGVVEADAPDVPVVDPFREAERAVGLADVAPADIAHRGVEQGVDGGMGHRDVHPVLDQRDPHIARQVVAGIVLLECPGEGSLGVELVGEREICVRAERPGPVAAARLAVQYHETEVGIGEYVAFHPERTVVGGGRNRPAVQGRPLALDVHGANGILADTARDLGAAVERGPFAAVDANGTGVEQDEIRVLVVILPRRGGHAEIEESGVFEEEIALFREIDVEAGDIHHLLFRFDLREIGVVGGIHRELRGDVIPDVEAGVGFGIGMVGAVHPGHTAAGVRLDLEIDAGSRGPDVGHHGVKPALELAVMPEPARDGNEIGGFIAVADIAADVETPFHGIALPVFERLEGKGHFRGPAALVDRGLDPPDAVPALVDVAALIADDGVALHPERIGHEGVAVAKVTERVDEQFHHIVAPDILVLPHGGGEKFPRLGVVGLDAEIDGVAILQHHHPCLLAGGSPVQRLLLEKKVLVGRRILPRLIVQTAVDRDGLVRRADLDTDVGTLNGGSRRFAFFLGGEREGKTGDE